MSKYISTQKGLKELLRRYKDAGVTNETMDVDNCYEAHWISEIEGCIREGLAMDEDDYNNTPKELRKLWRGLK